MSHHGGLAAYDATGANLPVSMDAQDETVGIATVDDGAVYPITIDPLITSTADTQLSAFQAGAQFGRFVAGAGDVNGDGFGDVIVGAELYDAGEQDEGAAFIVHGSATRIPSNSFPATTLQSNQALASLGKVAGAGDVNGDGYSAARGLLSIEPLANPTRGPIAFTAVLATEEIARVELFDIGGRRVLSRELAPGQPDRRDFQLGEGRALASGVYLLRLTQSGHSATAGVVLLH